MHTEPLGKSCNTQWCQTFKEMSDQLTTKLTEQRLKGQHKIKNTGFTELVQGSHYTNNKKTKATVSPGERDKSDFQICHTI